MKKNSNEGISIILPAYNELLNLLPLINEITDVFSNLKYEYEIIVVDDASEDKTKFQINNLSKKNKNIKLFSNVINKGQSYSIRKGVNNSSYRAILTMDSDGQNDPSDIPNLIKKYDFNLHKCLVSGLRIKRKDNIIKRYSSKVANYVRNLVFNDNCKDTGCALKIFDKEIFLLIPFFRSMHRFIPAFFNKYKCKIIYVPVNHRFRIHGKSNYGTFIRLIRGLYDLYYVKSIINKIK